MQNKSHPVDMNSCELLRGFSLDRTGSCWSTHVIDFYLKILKQQQLLHYNPKKTIQSSPLESRGCDDRFPFWLKYFLFVGFPQLFLDSWLCQKSWQKDVFTEL